MSPSTSVKFVITPARREAIDSLLRKTIRETFKAAIAVEAPLDHRYSNRAANKEKKIAGWVGYERYVLANGHTVYCSLGNPNEPKVSISGKPDKFAQAKVERREKKLAARAERKAAREANAKQVKVVKFDKKLPTVPASDRQLRTVKTRHEPPSTGAPPIAKAAQPPIRKEK